MNTVKLVRTAGSTRIFCKDLDRGVEAVKGEVVEVGEVTANDLMRDDPNGWAMELPPAPAETLPSLPTPAVIALPPKEG